MSTDQWTLYWQDGVSTSFGHSSPEWYGRTLIPFWERVFKELPVGAQILDVASGNGTVARIAANASKQHGLGFSITAVDKAQLAPATAQDPLLGEVEFISNMPLERLCLEGRAFDLVSSQYGVEYSSVADALWNIADMLKPGGQCVIVAHHVDSVVSNTSRHELQQYREILQPQGLYGKLRLLVQSMGEIRNREQLQRLASNPRSEKQRVAFNKLVDKLMRKFSEGAVIADALMQINPLFKQQVAAPLASKLAYIDAMENRMKLARQRLIDLLNAALDKKGLDRLVNTARNSGLVACTTETLDDEVAGLLAWVVKLDRELLPAD